MSLGRGTSLELRPGFGKLVLTGLALAALVIWMLAWMLI